MDNIDQSQPPLPAVPVAVPEASLPAKKEVKSGSKKLVFLLGLIALFLIVGCVFVYIQLLAKINLSAVIAFTEGEVEYQQDNSGWKTASVGMLLKQGSMIRVLSSGKAIINIDDGSSIRLNSNTAIRLDNLSPKNIVVTNSKGEIYTRVIKSERVFLVKTTGATYQAMGTAFKTTNNDDKKGIEVYESQVKILGMNSQNELLVSQGNQYYLVNTDNPDVTKSVTPININEVKKDEFVAWNKEQDEKVSEFKDKLGVLIALTQATPSAEITIVPTTKPSSNDAVPDSSSAKIILTGSAIDKGTLLKWTVVGMDSNLGFKVVRSKEDNPVYPGNDYQYLSEPSVRQYTWKVNDGESYHYRVCKYLGSSCGAYSNDIVVKSSTGDTSDTGGLVSSISVRSDSGSKIVWEVNGYSDQGFKVVWSKNGGPTYPTRDGDKYHYYTDPNKRDDILEAFDGGGAYHVRVCEYLGGKCGIYSNEIEVNL